MIRIARCTMQTQHRCVECGADEHRENRFNLRIETTQTSVTICRHCIVSLYGHLLVYMKTEIGI